MEFAFTLIYIHCKNFKVYSEFLNNSMFIKAICGMMAGIFARQGFSVHFASNKPSAVFITKTR